MTPNRIIPLKEVSEALGRTPKTIWRWWAKEKMISTTDSNERPMLGVVRI